MAIDSAKLLNRPSGSNTLSSKSVENVAFIATTVTEIATIMKGSLLLDKMRDKKKRQAAQQAKRNLKESGREKLGKSIKKSVQGTAANVSDWLNRLLGGVVLIGLVKLLPIIEPWIPRLLNLLITLLKV